MDIEYVYSHGSFKDLQSRTSLRENQLCWLDYIVSSMQKRKVAEILFSRGHSVKEVEDLLVLANGEAKLIKEHLDKFGVIDTKSILEKLTKIYQRETLEVVIERMIAKNYDKNTIEEVIKLFGDNK